MSRKVLLMKTRTVRHRVAMIIHSDPRYPQDHSTTNSHDGRYTSCGQISSVTIFASTLLPMAKSRYDGIAALFFLIPFRLQQKIEQVIGTILFCKDATDLLAHRIRVLWLALGV